jgi:putative tricarboxylic transport membrane protein
MRLVKNKGDFYSSLFWMLIGAGVSYGGYSLGMGAMRNPGPGFIFFWCGLIIIGFSLIIIAQDAFGKPSPEEMTPVWSDIRWKMILYTLISVLVFAYCFEFLGFLLSVMFLLLFLFKVVGSMTWVGSVTGAVASAILGYVVFSVWLGCQFPLGIFG